MTSAEPEHFQTASVADIALAFPQSIDTLNKYGLDYCCHGNTPFAKACHEANLVPRAVWSEIQSLAHTHHGATHMYFESWSASMIIDFILRHHHEYVREAIPQITELLEKVCNVHGDTNPELLAVRNEFEELADELLNHLPKEEEVLFPAIKMLEQHYNKEGSNSNFPGSLRMPILVMIDEHENAGSLIKSIRRRTDNYKMPSYACPTYQLTFIMLQEFERDLIQHIHLENNILFPKVKEMASN